MESKDIIQATRRPGGFTLVELLVVVAIIALLLAIMLPALSKAKRVAMFTKCMAQVRSFALTVTVYASDNATYLVPPNYDAASRGWLYDEKSGNSYVTPASKTVYEQRAAMRETGLLYPYLAENDSIYFCPADEGPFDDAKRPTRAMTSYQFSADMINYGGPKYGPIFEPFKIDQCKSSAIFLWENSETRYGWNDGANFADEPLTKRHTDGAPVGRLDGSSARMSAQEYEARNAWGKDPEFFFAPFWRH